MSNLTCRGGWLPYAAPVALILYGVAMYFLPLPSGIAISIAGVGLMIFRAGISDHARALTGDVTALIRYFKGTKIPVSGWRSYAVGLVLIGLGIASGLGVQISWDLVGSIASLGGITSWAALVKLVRQLTKDAVVLTEDFTPPAID